MRFVPAGVGPITAVPHVPAVGGLSCFAGRQRVTCQETCLSLRATQRVAGISRLTRCNCPADPEVGGLRRSNRSPSPSAQTGTPRVSTDTRETALIPVGQSTGRVAWSSSRRVASALSSRPTDEDFLFLVKAARFARRGRGLRAAAGGRPRPRPQGRAESMRRRDVLAVCGCAAPGATDALLLGPALVLPARLRLAEHHALARPGGGVR